MTGGVKKSTGFLICFCHYYWNWWGSEGGEAEEVGCVCVCLCVSMCVCVCDAVMTTQGKISLTSSLYSGLWWILSKHSCPLFESAQFSIAGCFLSHSLLVIWWCSTHWKHVISWHWHIEAPLGYIILLCSRARPVPGVLRSYKWSALRYFVCQLLCTEAWNGMSEMWA